jgi:uncharacterized membrane protein YesL
MLKTFYKKSMDVVFVNFLWIITSLIGIFLTLGASTTALFKVIFQIIRYDEPTSVWDEFKKSFKENFVFSTIVWLILVVFGTSIYLLYINALSHNNDILLVLAVVGIYQWVIFFIYFFPVNALFKTDKPLTMIKNVMIMSNTNIWINIKVIGSFALVFILVVFIHPSFLVIAIGLYGFLVSFHLRKRFEPYLEQFEKNIETEEE